MGGGGAGRGPERGTSGWGGGPGTRGDRLPHTPSRLIFFRSTASTPAKHKRVLSYMRPGCLLASQAPMRACQWLSAREASPLIPPAESRAALPATPSPPRPPESHGYPPPPPAVFSCSRNGLGAEGATALSSGLTDLTKLQSIDVR